MPNPLSVALLVLALLLAGGHRSAHAQVVVLSGVLGTKALLVVDGGEPKAVAAGESYRGVKVISTQGENAVLEIGGRRQSMRIGEAPVSVGKPVGPGSGGKIVLSASTGGHFVTQGLINSRPVQFMVDTGATTTGIGSADADRIGLRYKQGQLVQIGTANGTAIGWQIRLSSVRLNDVEVFDIDAVVTPYPMPFILLGNSYLTRFQMTRNNDQMVLEKRF